MFANAIPAIILRIKTDGRDEWCRTTLRFGGCLGFAMRPRSGGFPTAETSQRGGAAKPGKAGVIATRILESTLCK